MVAQPATTSQTVSLDKVDPETKRLLGTFYGVGKYYLGLPIMDVPVRRKVGECRGTNGELYYEYAENDKQRRVIDAVDRQGSRVTVRTCNGAGKTTVLIPTCVLGFMTLYPRGKVVITSGVERQVRAQIFPALKAHNPRLQGWDFTDNTITAPNGAVAIGFSTNDGGRFEGWHGNKNPFYDLLQHDGPLMILVDEAKSVAPQIFDAIDRCTYQFLLEASSCGGSTGEFYKSHTSHSRFYQPFQITAADCPYADHDKNRDLIEKRGITDPLVKSKVFAEFMGEKAGTVIKRAWVEACLSSPPRFSPGTRRVFCDFAGGGDENVIAEREGNRVRLVDCWREADTMRACGRFITHFRKLGFTPENIGETVAGDGDGLGKPMLDRLAELGWHLHRDHNGGRATQPGYKNYGAETWYEGSKAIEKGAVILEGVDDEAVTQLTERQGWAASNGDLEVESKKDMKARGLGSPDRADAILGALREPAGGKSITVLGKAHGRDTGLLEQMIEEQGGDWPAGAQC